MVTFLRARGALGNNVFLALMALALGLLIARLPLPIALALIGGGALLAFALVEPLAGLAFMLLLGPAEPLLLAAYPNAPILWGQIGVAIFVGGWTLRSLARREFRWPLMAITIPFAVYLFAITLSFTTQQVRSPFAAMLELVKWAEMYLVAGIVVETAGRKKLGWVIAILFLVGMMQAAIGFWQFQFRGHGPEGFRILGAHFRAYGTFEQPNPFGGFMGMVWPIAAVVTIQFAVSIVQGRKYGTLMTQTRSAQIHADFLTTQRLSAIYQRHQRSIFIIAAIVTASTLAALFLSFSRGAWLGAVAAATAMLIFWPRRRWVGLGLAAGGLATFLILYNLGLLPAAVSARFADVGDFVQVYDVRGVHINDSNFAIVERLAHWQAALNMAEANPVFGVGLNNYEYTYDDYRLINWKYALGHAHMIYLNVLAETGFVGLAAYLFLWGGVVYVTVRLINRKDLSGSLGALSLRYGVLRKNLTGLDRALAVGLLGVWVHLSTHQILDNLYVGNIALYLGALLGVLCILCEAPRVKRNPQASRFASCVS